MAAVSLPDSRRCVHKTSAQSQMAGTNRVLSGAGTGARDVAADQPEQERRSCPHSSCVMRQDKFDRPRYKHVSDQKHEARAMTAANYDVEADTLYIALGRGTVERTRSAGPFMYEVDIKGHIVGIEIRSASKVLAPGDWKRARARKAIIPEPRQPAERHRGFIFIKRSSPPDAESQ